MIGKEFYKIGDRVECSAELTGDGINHIGTVTHVEVFLDTLYLTISFDQPTANGYHGTVCINPRLVTKIIG